MGFLANDRRVVGCAVALVLVALAHPGALASAAPDSHGGEDAGYAVLGVTVSTDGAALPGVIVELAGGESKWSTVSDADGVYSFSTVKPGDYAVTFKATGKKKAKMNITVADGDVDMGKVTLK